MEFKQLIYDAFGDAALQVPELSFVISNEYEFHIIMTKIAYKPKVVLETGTASGCSALLLAQYADEIVTFDVIDVPMKYDIWKHFGVHGKITAHTIKDTSEIPGLLTKEFDFAFIDGDHSYEGCSKDIAIAEKCGRLLFHDIYHSPIISAIRDLTKRKGGIYFVCGPTFGYWSNKS